ncbi:YcaO-like family protein [Cystobacter fuscus]|nr:YcaO-like family protein [Cystobacter fuscus]
MERTTLAGLDIEAPCVRCAQLWLPLESMDLEVDPDHLANPLPRVPRIWLRDPDGIEFSRPYLPHPECSRHLEHRERVDGASDLLRYLTPGPLGPIKARNVEGGPQGPYVSVAIMDRPRQVSAAFQPLVGAGVAFVRAEAELKASIEALERFSLFLRPRAPIVYHTKDTRSGQTIHDARLSPGLDRWWVEARGRRTGDVKLVPLELINPAVPPPEPGIRGSSTGLAVHPDAQAAFRAGCLEFLERAALATLWAAQLKFLLRPRALTGPGAEWIEPLERLGFDVELSMEQPIPGVHVAVAFGRSRAESAPSLVVCSGAGCSPSEAIASALRELYGHCTQALRSRTERPRDGLPTPFDHLLFYLNPANADGLLRDWGYHQAERGDHLENTVECELEDILEAAHVEAYVLDRGNLLTDFLGLHALHTILPALRILERDTGGPRPWPTPFG